MAGPPRRGFKKRHLLSLLVVLLGIIALRHQLPAPIGDIGIAIVEGIETMTQWLGRHLAMQ
jgi:hypothetical protein